MLSDPLFWLVAILAVTVVGVSKGGFAGLGVLGTPLLALVMPPVKAAAILLPILILQDWVSLVSYRRSVDRRELLAGTTAWFFAVVNLMKVAPYLMLGQFSRENLMLSVALAPVAIATTILGVWLVRRVDSERFYRIVYALLVL